MTGDAAAKRYYLAHVNDETDQCMIWPFSTNEKGYGLVRLGDGTQRKVHAAACEHHHGPRPPGHLATHGPCHNPRCWNGRHLAWATASENERDKRRDGTTNPRRFPERDAEITARYRAGGITQAALAAEYGIPRPHVSRIVNRQLQPA